MSTRTDLLELLATHAYQFRPDKPFTLASGKQSPEYLDCRVALSHPRAMVSLGATVLERLDRRCVAIGGLTLGADPIAMSVCQQSATGSPVRWFTVRKEPKAHGRGKLIEGAVASGERVVVVDDVVTSGDSTIKAIKACREAGLEITQVIVLVDREELDGMNKIRLAVGENVDVSSIFTKSEIKDKWLQLNRPPETFPKTG